MSVLERLDHWAGAIKLDVHAVYLAARDPRVPWHAKVLAIAVAAYALSPIDLIPDFVPVLGHIDDLVILPLGIWLVVHMIPPEIMAKHRAAASLVATRPASRVGAVVVIAIWLFLAVVAGWIAYGILAPSPI